MIHRVILAVAALLPLPQVPPAQEIFPEYTWQALGNGIYVHMRADGAVGVV